MCLPLQQFPARRRRLGADALRPATQVLAHHPARPLPKPNERIVHFRYGDILSPSSSGSEPNPVPTDERYVLIYLYIIKYENIKDSSGSTHTGGTSDPTVVHQTGAETISGSNTFSNPQS